MNDARGSVFHSPFPFITTLLVTEPHYPAAAVSRGCMSLLFLATQLAAKHVTRLIGKLVLASCCGCIFVQAAEQS